MEIDPWATEGVQNYKEICEKFGLETINPDELPSPTHLHRRGIIFAHRDLDNVLEARNAGRPFHLRYFLSCLFLRRKPQLHLLSDQEVPIYN